MLLYLVRHGAAETADVLRWPDDRGRPLTNAGEDKLAKAAPALKTLASEVDLVLSSRLVRAWQTAEILARKGGWPEPEPCPALEPGGTSAEIVDAVREHGQAQSVAVVGHEPILSHLAGYLLFGQDDVAPVDFKKGAIVSVEFGHQPGPGAGHLRWFLTPRLLRALA
jgi:phosphohistidine phosphatase